MVSSDGSLGMQGCMNMGFPLISKSQRSVGSTLLEKFQSLFAAGQQEKNGNANAIETAVASNQLFSKAVLGHTSPS